MELFLKHSGDFLLIIWSRDKTTTTSRNLRKDNRSTGYHDFEAPLWSISTSHVRTPELLHPVSTGVFLNENRNELLVFMRRPQKTEIRNVEFSP